MTPNRIKAFLAVIFLAGALSSNTLNAQSTTNPEGRPNSGRNDNGGMQGVTGSRPPDTTSHKSTGPLPGGVIAPTGPNGRTGPTGPIGTPGVTGPTGPKPNGPTGRKPK